MSRSIGVLGILWLALAGCAHQQTRLQAEDEREQTRQDKVAAVETIGKVSAVANADPVAVSGIGLVVGLEGTGGGAPAGPYREMLEDDLRKRDVKNVKEVLASPTTSLVLVSARIPPGARKDDPLDIDVTLPPGSRTTSLRGGRLVECYLYNYDTKKNLNPNYQGTNQALLGHKVARAQGPLVVDFGDGDQAARQRRAHIWGGGHCLEDRPFYLILNADQQYARVARAAADRINETFQGTAEGPTTDVAVAKTKAVVALGVPPQYHLNLPRYLRVIRLIPLWATAADRIPYRRLLEEQLLDPAHTLTAALRLEALGQDSIPTLKRGLTSEHLLVRFCSAEALAYLGSPASGEELARAVEEQPALRAFGLTALASLDEAVCHVQLRRLLHAKSAETRYGAFRALRALDEHDDAVQGESLADAFTLYRVAPESGPLVHVNTHQAEVVLFGEDAVLVPPFPILAGEFTIAAKEGDDHCTISRISLRHGKRRQQCSLKLEEVLRTLADLGAGYTDVVEFLRRANDLQCLSCQVAVDSLPQAPSVYDLAKAGTGGRESPAEIAQANELGATPTLFDKGDRPLASAADEDNAPQASRPKDAAKTARRGSKAASPALD